MPIGSCISCSPAACESSIMFGNRPIEAVKHFKLCDKEKISLPPLGWGINSGESLMGIG